METLPLSGLRILDLSRVLAGPLCTMILGDLGANVIKVERPEGGDDTRGWGPPFDAAGRSAYFLSINRNKLSVALDLSTDAGAALVRALAAQADVVVDNFQRGVLERWGLAPQRLLAEHPRLIWCTITGFGPDSDRPGYDFVVQAESGWMAITGEPTGAPMKVGVALADVIAGKDAAIAILAALAGRDHPRDAGARHLTISLAHSAIASLVNVAQNALVSGRGVSRWGNAHPNLVPYQLFDALDRPIVIAVGSDAQFIAAMRALGLTAMAEDERYRTNSGRLAHREAVVGAIAERIRTQPAAAWLAALEGARVPCGVVKPVLEALRDVEASPLTGVAPLAPGSVRREPPMLDQHGALVRARGWDAFQSP
ncbi:MAG TPA: CoA transferase [Gemmatimonadaceae bacterium]|jgi:crotonobetainyl-CoA:carnitine CoA-transferase CaiB-like acyl-CoA transferase